MTRLQLIRRRLGLLDGKTLRVAAAEAASRTAVARRESPSTNWQRIIHE